MSKKKPLPPRIAAPPQVSPLWDILFIGVCTCLIIFLYSGALNYGFLYWDDQRYIVENALIRQVDIGGFFTTLQVAENYHPLTLLVYSIEYYLQGPDPFLFHLVSVLFHAANTILVFLFMKKMRMGFYPAAFIALLFGLYPTHVESVAWVSELKDVLYVFFVLLAVLTYISYRNTGVKKWYYLTLGLFVCALLSKAMAVILPPLLILIDYYSDKEEWNWNNLQKSITGKITFLGLSLTFGVVAIIAQAAPGAVSSAEWTWYPLFDRLVFACYEGWIYFIKAIYPFGLSPFYSYPMQTGEGNYPTSVYLCAVLSLLVIAAGVAVMVSDKWKTYRKEVVFGLRLFLVCLAVIVKIIPVGYLLMADRYSYLAYLGVWFMITVAVTKRISKLEIENRKLAARFAAGIAGLYLLVVVMPLTKSYIKVWESDATMLRCAIGERPTDAYAYAQAGAILLDQNKPNEARPFLQKALLYSNPPLSTALVNLSHIYINEGKYDSATALCNLAIRYYPKFIKSYMSKGAAHLGANQPDLAVSDFLMALELPQTTGEAYEISYNMGVAYQMKQQPQSADEYFKKAEVYKQKALKK